MTTLLLRGQSRDALIHRIESINEQIFQQLENGTSLTIHLQRRARGSNTNAGPSTSLLSFPGRDANDAWRFAVGLRLLDIIHEALIEDVVLSKRDVYYRDPALFNTQETVDRYLEDLAITLQADRAQLNVTAALKGLMYGSVTIHHRDGSIQLPGLELCLIPDAREINSIDVSSISWVLVVEKEASFRACVDMLAAFNNHAGGLILTAKGYPDHITKAFVHMLATPTSKNMFSAKPIYTLVDYDPDGYAIHACYSLPENHGSRISLLGLSFDQLHLCEAPNDPASLLLTARDRTRARNMLAQRTDDDGTALELQRMLCLNVKYELQHLSEFNNALLGVLKRNIREWQDQ